MKKFNRKIIPKKIFDTSMMTEEEVSKCRKIIHGATVGISAIAGGLAQVPVADSAAIAPIQIGMIMSLAEVFDIGLTKSSAGAILANQITEQIGKAGVKIVLKYIPGIGNVANAAVSASVNETLGWTVAKDFAKRNKLNA